MRLIERREILDYLTYEDERERFRARVLKAKAQRRIHLGEYFTLLFENRLTVRYQIQEMIRTERIVREADIIHEIRTYNELLPPDGALSCTLLIEIEDAATRDKKLKEWWDLPEKIHVTLEDGVQVYASFDERQRGDGRLSSVQYLKFNTGGAAPISVGAQLPDLQLETPLTREQRKALFEDLIGAE
jgi:hypothetical protein